MKSRVEPEVQPKSNGTKPKQTDNAPKPVRKCDKSACKRQYVPASKAYGKRAISQPNSGVKPASSNGNNQNKTQIRDVPSYIRTEMEILKHLRRVNYNLKILLKPACHCHKTQRNQKCCEPARKRKEQQAFMARLNLPTRRKSSISKKGAALPKPNKRAGDSLKGNTTGAPVTAVIKNDAPTGNSTQGDHLPENRGVTAAQQSQQAEPKDRNHKCSCSEKCKAFDQQPPSGPTKFQRFMLCFKPKLNGKCDKCKCAQAAKLQDGKTKQAAASKNFHGKCGHHGCEKHLSTLTKRDSKVTFKPRRASQLKKGKKSTKGERTLKQKMLGSCIKCLGKDDEPAGGKIEKQSAAKKDENAAQEQKKSIATSHNTRDARKENVQATNQTAKREGRVSPEEQEPEKENEKAIAVAEVLQKCLRLFKPRKKEPQAESEEGRKDTHKEYKMRETRKKRSHDVLTTLAFFPKPSHIKVRYVDDLEEFKKTRVQSKKRETYYYEAKGSNMKTPTDTPSTSSLEEYYQRLSERMEREQKEADERRPPPRRKRVVTRARLQPTHRQPRRIRIGS